MIRYVVAASVGALLAAAPAAAVTVTTAPGAPDPGMAAGEMIVVSFDAANAAGVTNVTSGNVITAAGSTSGVRAAPAGTPVGNVYQSIGNGGSSTFDFTQFSRGHGLKSVSFYWGSVDSFNFVDLLAPGGTVIRTISGAALPQSNGNQTASNTNRRAFFTFAPAETVTALRLRSTGNAFEFDTIAASAVPEPASWALLIAGFGMIGIAMRRPRARTVSA